MARRKNPRLWNEDGTPKAPYARDGRMERFETILAAEDVEVYTHIRARDTDIFPKRERGGLALRMENEATAAYELLVEANELDLRIDGEREERLRLQRKALVKLRLLNHHIEYLHSPPTRISNETFEYWTDLISSCRNQAAGWHKSDKNRAENIERQRLTAIVGQLAKAIGEAVARAIGSKGGERHPRQ